MSRSERVRSELIQLIAEHEREHGYAITMPELAAATGLTKSSIHGHLSRLRDEGRVDWEARRARTLRAVPR